MIRGPLINQPAYSKMRDILIQRVSSGEFKPGMLIPSESDIAREYSVSVGTVRKAMALLEQEHIIERRQGRGTFVSTGDSTQAAARFVKVHNLVGERVWGAVVSKTIKETDANEADIARLKLKPGERVYKLNRLRSDENGPFMYEEATLPLAKFPELAAKHEASTRSFYAIAQEYGYLIGKAEERISTTLASADLAEQLAVPANAPLAVLDRVAYDVEGVPVERRVAWCDLQTRYYAVNL